MQVATGSIINLPAQWQISGYLGLGVGVGVVCVIRWKCPKID